MDKPDSTTTLTVCETKESTSTEMSKSSSKSGSPQTKDFIFDIRALDLGTLADKLLISPDLLLKATLNYLLFDDCTDWQRMGEKFSQDPAEMIPLSYHLDQWWMEKAEMMNDLFADLIAARPFKWKRVFVCEDEFAKIVVTSLEKDPWP